MMRNTSSIAHKICAIKEEFVAHSCTKKLLVNLLYRLVRHQPMKIGREEGNVSFQSFRVPNDL